MISKNGASTLRTSVSPTLYEREVTSVLRVSGKIEIWTRILRKSISEAFFNWKVCFKKCSEVVCHKLWNWNSLSCYTDPFLVCSDNKKIGASSVVLPKVASHCICLILLTFRLYPIRAVFAAASRRKTGFLAAHSLFRPLSSLQWLPCYMLEVACISSSRKNQGYGHTSKTSCVLRVCVCISICPSTGVRHINFQEKEALMINCNCTTLMLLCGTFNWDC